MPLTANQLRQAADIQERIEALQNELQQILQGAAPTAVPTYGARRAGGPRKRFLSPEAVENIRAGVRKRMARMQKAVASGEAPARPKKKISPEGRARLAAIARARWKRVKALGKSRL